MAKLPDNFDSGVPASEAAIVVAWYQALAERAIATINDPAGRTSGSKDFRRARAASQLDQLRRLAASIDQQAADWIGRRYPQLFQEAYARADQLAAEAGVRVDNILVGDFNLVDSPSLGVFARDTLIDLRKSSGGIVVTADRVLRATADNGLTQSQINAILATGVAEGTPAATTRAIRDELIRVNEGKVIEINGRHYQAQNYADMVVRTKTREAVVTARTERFSGLGIDLVAITGRLSDNFCTAFLGQVYSISGKHPTYPPLSSLPGGGPPFHPNCSKGVRPYIEDLATPGQQKAAVPSSAVADLIGKTPAEAQRMFRDLQLRAEASGRVKGLVNR